MRLIADKAILGGKYQAWPGDEFDCPDNEVAGLIEAKAAHPAPKKVERAVEAQAVEKAVDEPEVQERVTPPEPVSSPAPKKRRGRKRAPKKVSK